MVGVGRLAVGLWAVSCGVVCAEGFSFEYDIAPRLARAGCAAAECHGGATGRGGFKLSLFATNPRADYEAIVQELGGRRVDLLEAAESLVLLKPTRGVKHEGGKVIEKGGEDYEVLKAWIGRGAQIAEGETGELVGLKASLADGRVVVEASFSSGGDVGWRDVTGMARFESTNGEVVAVDESGEVEVRGAGESWILARYSGLTARVVVREGFGKAADSEKGGGELDRIWELRLRELGLTATAEAERHVLLRRLTHDLAGRPPTLNEVEDAGEIAVGELVGKLMSGEEFEEQVVRFMGDWFEVPEQRSDLRHTAGRNERLRGAVRRFVAGGEGIDGFVRGVFGERELGGLIGRFGDPRDRSEFVGRTLLGIGLECARCHNHPGDRWTQAQHLEFSAYFANARPAAGGGGEMVDGMFFLPGDGKAVEPVLLPIGEGSVDEALDRDEVLARFVLQSGREALARNVANRVFEWLLGRPLVEPAGDHRAGNPALHEPVLEYLAALFLERGMKIRPLVEEIVSSRWYAVSGEPVDIEGGALGSDPELTYLARREARALEGDGYLRAVESVLGVEVQAVAAETPLAMQLQVLNGGVLREALGEPGNQVDAIFDFELDEERQLEALFKLVLARSPRDGERAAFLPVLTDGGRDAGRDLAFALLAGREFSSVR